ncbi:MAG: hypothetical protein SPG09_07270 [Lachnospiraceae bacterium]|nr:hypothetical protein [bacterium]MDY5517392.1 hypothetical protein [Lachnospiraceae bacterium]
MKVTGINSADLVSALYDHTTQGSSKKKDSNSIENLLTSNMTSNNPAMARLARKAESKDYYKKALSAAEQSDELLRKLSDEKKSVFVKAADTQDEQAKEEYQTEAAKDIASLLNSHNTMIANLMEAGGNANKNFLSELNQLMKDYGKELSAVGITRNEDGTLALDAETLAGADMDVLSEVFGPDADFSQKLTGQMDTIVQKTATTVDTLQIYSTAYSNSGSYSQYDYLKGIYDLKA